MKYDNNKACGRLKELRESKGWSQREMAIALSGIITERALDGANGKSTVSQLERNARGITIEYAFAYAEIFGVSLDYLFGISDDWLLEYRQVKETTGLNDEIIRILDETIEMRCNRHAVDILSHFIRNVDMWMHISELIDDLARTERSRLIKAASDALRLELSDGELYEDLVHFACVRALAAFVDGLVREALELASGGD